MRRDNTLEARRHKQAVRCWQLAGLRKAWATWVDHMGRRADAVQALRRVGMRLHAASPVQRLGRAGRTTTPAGGPSGYDATIAADEPHLL